MRAHVPHLPRWLAIVMAALSVLGVVVAVGTWWAMGTGTGARWTVERLGAFMPGKLTIQETNGRVRGPLTARGVTYETDHFKLTADRVYVDWRLRYLAIRRLDIRSLEADGVRLVMFPGPEKAQHDTLNELADVDLPLDVMITRARFHDFHFTAAGSDTATVLDDVQMDRLALRDTLSIGGVRMRSATFDADMAGGATLRGRHPIRLDVNWTWRGGGQPLQGRGPVVGDLDRLHVAQTLHGALDGDADVVVLHGLRNPQFTGVLNVRNFRPRDLNPGWPEGRATGRVTLAGRPGDLRSDGTVRATLPQMPGVVLTYRAERAGDRLVVREARIDGPGGGNRVFVTGTIVTGGREPDMHLAGRWQAIAWPPGDSAIVSPAGTFRLAGAPSSYRMSAEGRVGTRTVRPMPLQVAGTGSGRGITFSSIHSRALGGAIAGTGAIDWAGGMDWRVALRASGVDPSTAWPQYPGRVGFGLRASGAAAVRGMRGQVALAGLTGTVRDYPVSGNADAAFAPGRLAIRSLDLGWGPNRATAQGAVGGPWSLNAKVDAPDLGVVLAGGTGSLHATVATSGAGAKPRMAVNVTGDTIRWGSGSLQHVAGTGDVDLGGGGASRVDLQAEGLRSGNRRLVRVGVTGSGSLRSHTLEARASGEKDSLRVAMRGGWVRGEWEGMLEAIDLATVRAGNWALEQPAPTTLSPSRIHVESMAWRSGAARVDGHLDWRRVGAWHTHLRLDNVPLAVAEPWFTPGIGLEGTFEGVADASGNGSRNRMDADLVVGPGALTWPSDAGRGRARLDRGTVRVRTENNVLAAHAAITSPDAGVVDADMRVGLASGPRPQLTTLDGTAHARLDSLDFLQAFVPGLRRTTGRLTADLHVAGPVARPAWSGNAQLTGGSADVQRLGIHVQDVTLTARGEQSRRLALQLRATSEGGTLAFDGEGNVTKEGALRATGRVHGERFEIMDNPDGRIVVTPDIQLTAVGDSLRVQGVVVVPAGELRAQTTGEQVVKPSRDVVLVTPAGEVDRRDPNLIAEVRVTLGDDVHIATYGLKGRVEGSILVIDRPGWPSSGTGELRIVDGTYRAYGQNLQIERGRLIFAGGPLKNPGLDARATRTAGNNVTAGFEVRGTLEAPRLTVVSDPPMSQQDALGYVLFGRPMQGASTNEQAMVRDAGNTLGVAGGSFLASKVAQPLGLDEASVQSTGGFNQASLMLGRYISPRLYINYGIGILDQVSTVRLRYTLSRMWTLQAESGNETRGQVQYTVEK